MNKLAKVMLGLSALALVLFAIFFIQIYRYIQKNNVAEIKVAGGYYAENESGGTEFTEHRAASGTTFDVFEDDTFYVNEIKANGEVTITNNGRNVYQDENGTDMKHTFVVREGESITLYRTTSDGIRLEITFTVIEVKPF